MPMSSASVGKSGKRFMHRADARWLMSYAAGLGQSSSRYLDTQAVTCGSDSIAAHPLFPVCLEWPVILDVPNIEHAGNMLPGEGARGVHAMHDLRLHRPIVVGEELFTTLTVVGVEARAPGAFQSMRISTVDAAGLPVATTWQGSLYRGVDVVGPDRELDAWPDRPQRPESAESAGAVEVAIAPEAAHVYTECARIFNPIHTDRAVALEAGLPDIILHGTASLAHAVNAVVDNLLGGEPTRVRRIAGRFAGMLLLPGRLRVDLQHVESDGCFFEVTNAAGDPVIRSGYVGFQAD